MEHKTTKAHQLRDRAHVAAENSGVEENHGLPRLVGRAVSREDHMEVILSKRESVATKHNRPPPSILFGHLLKYSKYSKYSTAHPTVAIAIFPAAVVQ